jgi:hypothetical protein
MPNQPPPTDDQFLSAAAFLANGLKTFDQALKHAGGHNEHTDTVRAHVAGARWMYEAIFGAAEGARLDRKAHQESGVDIPHAGPRVDAHGKTHG